MLSALFLPLLTLFAFITALFTSASPYCVRGRQPEIGGKECKEKEEKKGDKRRSLLSLLPLFFSWALLSQIPTSLTPTTDVRVDRRAYALAPAFFSFLALTLHVSEKAAKQTKWITLSTALCLCLLYSYRSSGVGKAFRSEEGVWREVLNMYPSNVRALNNMAILLTKEGRSDEAMAMIVKTGEYTGWDATALNNAGELLLGSSCPSTLEEYNQIDQLFSLSHSRQPSLVQPVFNRALLRLLCADSVEVWSQYRQDRGEGGVEEGKGQGGEGDTARDVLASAESLLLLSLQLDPYHEKAINNLAVLNWRKGEKQKAVRQLQAGLQRCPDSVLIRSNLATFSSPSLLSPFSASSLPTSLPTFDGGSSEEEGKR
mmetsp:Transcript_38119/g.98442  ORF Transcript_38119/g.98442 Transcript_38119/m.98442 type:complete len:372 (-) Transcript_38119:114-1229(-)